MFSHVRRSDVPPRCDCGLVATTIVPEGGGELKGRAMAKYRLCKYFETGSGTCLWPCNDASYQNFDYASDAQELPLPENT